MTKDFFLQILNSHLKFGTDLKNFDWDRDLRDFGLDSISLIELLVDLEEKLNVLIPDEYLENDTFSTANKLWDTIKEMKSTDTT
jgi:acyl carrier protein